MVQSVSSRAQTNNPTTSPTEGPMKNEINIQLKTKRMKLKNSSNHATWTKPDFQWREIPEKDYYYFLDARIYSHANTFGNYLSRQQNVWYPCLKPNGDLNSIFSVSKKYKGMVVFITSNQRELTGVVFEHVRADVATGQIGKVVYHVKYIEDTGFVLYKCWLDSWPEKNKLLMHLKQYRTGGIKTEANERFNDKYYFAEAIRPHVVTDPYRKKHQALFAEVPK